MPLFIRLTLCICFISLGFKLDVYAQNETLQLTLPFGHNTSVENVSFSEDGKLLLSTAKREVQLRIWDLKSGKLLFSSDNWQSVDQYKGGSYDGLTIIENAKLSPKGNFVYINGQFLWNTHTNELIDTDFGSLVKYLGDNYMLTHKGVVDLRSGRGPQMIHKVDRSPIDLIEYNNKLIGIIFKDYDRSILIKDLTNDTVLWQAESPYSNSSVPSGVSYADKSKNNIWFDQENPIVYMNINKGYFDKTSKWFENANTVEEKPSVIYQKGIYHWEDDEFRTEDVQLPKKRGNVKISSDKLFEELDKLNFPRDSVIGNSLDFSIPNLMLSAGLVNGDIMVWDLRSKTLVHRLSAKIYPSLMYFKNDSTLVNNRGGLHENLVVKSKVGALREIETRSLEWDLENNKFKQYPFDVNLPDFITNGKEFSTDPLLNDIFFKFSIGKGPRYESGDKQKYIQTIVLNQEKPFLYEYVDGQITTEIEEIFGCSYFLPFITFSPDGRYIYFSTEDYKITIYDLQENSIVDKFGRHQGFITMLHLSPNGKWIMSSSVDGTNKVYDLDKREEICSISIVNNQDWVVTSPSGLFDASPNAMNLIYYVYDKKEVIDLEQLKTRYWEPGLLKKLLGFDKNEIRSVIPFEKLKIYPELTAKIADDQLRYKVTAREGGLGKVSLWINNKMVEEDINVNKSSNWLYLNLLDYEKYFLKDFGNNVSIRAYNEEGWLPGPPVDLTYPPDLASSRGVIPIHSAREYGKVKVHGIFVGTNDYSGESLDLSFADEDAFAMYSAVEASASQLWGAEKLNMHLLTTDIIESHISPSKENIKRIFEEDFIDAKPQDILVIYFSGHGVAYLPDGNDESTFYYLTKDVNSFDLDDSEVRESYTISSKELETWIGKIPSLYQILVIDACNSGTVVSAINPGMRAASADQIKAIDRMKDRTGMNIIVGSAADKVSFESSEFGQGLLTYSLLLGMQKAALREDRFVDVSKLFSFAAEQVPVLAKGLGKIQQPQLMTGASFDLGIVNDSVLIQVGKKKPVFIRSNFQNKEQFLDNIQLAEAMDRYLMDIASDNGAFLFIDARSYKDAFKVVARYYYEPGKINVQGKLFKGEEFLGDFNVTGGDPSDLSQVASQIMDKLMTLIPK